LSSRKARGIRQPYPIKLFYASNVGILLQACLVSNYYFLTHVLSRKFRGNFIVSLLGRWEENELGPTGGLAYYISPPQGLLDIRRDPIHVVVYIAFTVCACAFFSRIWLDVSGTSSRDVARQLLE